MRRQRSYIGVAALPVKETGLMALKNTLNLKVKSHNHTKVRMDTCNSDGIVIGECAWICVWVTMGIASRRAVEVL